MERLLAKYTNSYLSYVILFFFYNISFALFSSMISVYLIGKGYAASQVSMLVSIASLAAMLTQPIIGGLTEKFGMRAVNMVMFGLTCAAAGLFVISPGFWITVGAYSLMNLLLNGLNPTVERMATSSPYSYGSVRTWGTIGFATGTQLTGIVYSGIGPEAPYICVIIAALLAILGFWGTNPRIAETESANIEDTAEGEDGAEGASMKDLLTNKLFLFYLLLQVLFTAVTGAAYSFTPAALTDYLGMEASTASTVLAVAALCEIPLLLFSSKFMDKVPNKILLLIAFGGALLQVLPFALGLPFPIVIAITFLTKHPPAILNIMTNMKVVNTIVDPRQQITGLALVKTCQSFGMIVSNNIGGRIVDAAGYPPMYLFLLGIIAVGLLGVVFFKVPSGNDKKLFS
ncbi:MAG: MFS transporter [Coriobacteriales bacterium]|nr:MFS transporter [Coriobacteriales bacterium]